MSRFGSMIAACAAVAVAMPALALAADDAKRGADIFENRCVFCHTPGGGGQGPNLVGVVGRRAGSIPDYAYSDALKKSGLVWSTATLDEFLSAPGKLVPGTWMQISLPDDAERADLIAYLASLGAKP
jgi:cytochrome c